MTEKPFTDNQLDAIREHLNIGIGEAAADLSDIIEREIQLKIPNLEVKPTSEFNQALSADRNQTSVSLPFAGLMSGISGIFFSEESASRLVELVTGDPLEASPEMDSIREATILEIGNIMINGMMAAFANAFETELDFQPPIYLENGFDDIAKTKMSNEDYAGSFVICGETLFNIESEQVTGRIYVLFMVKTLQTVFKAWE